MPWPEPDWRPIHPFPFAEARRPFTGPGAEEGPVVLRYFLRPDGGLVALADFGPLSEGAPGQAHGGAILTVLDEALGAAAWAAGHPVLTVRLATEFRRPVPLGANLLVETRILRTRHRMVFVEGELRGETGVHASAQGRFLALGPEARERLLRRPS